jgi:phosphoglycerate dehydrogenase-like enzyme
MTWEDMELSETTDGNRVEIVIATPLEPELVDRIRVAGGERANVSYRPDLLPSMLYRNDHTGPRDWWRDERQQAEWEGMLARAEVLWDLPRNEAKSISELCPRLRWVQTTSAGVGPMIMRLGLAESDLIVTTASGVHAGPLAEFVLGALLFHTKQFRQLQEWQQARTWKRYSAGELAGQTVTIIGPGRIGREIARLAKAFGMRVIAVGSRTDPDRAQALAVDEYCDLSGLDRALRQADCLVLCCPHTRETDGLIDRRAISLLEPGAVLVNISRGAVIDEEAMIDALRSGRIAFAALDVFRIEPLPADSPLWDMPNVLISPHSASTADLENERITDLFIRNLKHYLDGRYDQMSPMLDKRRGY